MRALSTALALGILSACAPAVPDSGAGVGFDNSIAAQRAREAELAGSTINGDPLIPPVAVSSETLAPATGTGTGTAAGTGTVAAVATPAQVQSASSAGSGNAEDIARETAVALAAATANSGVAPLQASPSNPAPRIAGNPAISDENDFAAVSGRESIESDAERIARNKARYQPVAPTAVPERSGNASPNIVSYALQASNPVGTRVYSRSGLNLAAKSARNCARYPSPDQAQSAFLSNGGPQRDKLALDPDGDGFACSWDPSPFRQAVKN